MFSQQDAVYNIFYNDRLQGNVFITIVRTVFYLMPTFTMSVIYGTIGRRASTHLDSAQFAWIKGHPYSWDQFMENEVGVFSTGDTFNAPSPCRVYMYLIGSVFFFIIMTWYFDHIISSNRGVSDPPYFIFTRKYWRSVIGGSV